MPCYPVLAVTAGLVLLAPTGPDVALTGLGSSAQSHVTGHPAVEPSSGYSLPVDGGVVVTLFQRPAERWLAGHRGVDLAADRGEEVHAPASGTVIFAGSVVDRGVVTILHADGRRSSLEPVHEGPSEGTLVRAGEVVGSVQDVPGHCGDEGCVHWGVRDGEEYVDPLSLLPGGGPVVLLPLRHEAVR